MTILFAFAACLASPVASAAGAEGAPSASPAGELIVGFSPEASRADRNDAIDGAGADSIRKIDGMPATLVEPAPGVTAAEAARSLRGQPGVTYVEPNSSVRSLRLPSDPMFKSLWAFSNQGQLGGAPGADIGAAEAWNVVTGGDVKVGIVDTGLDVGHPDLAANVWTNPGEPVNGRDDDRNGFIDDVHGADLVDGDGSPGDAEGHGTHVAGTIAAAANNGIGVAGISWQAQLVGVRFLDATGAGSMADAADAIDYAVDRGVRIINASWGGPDFSRTLYEAIARANDRGVLFVAASGNNGENADQTPTYPAAYDLPNIISVASTNDDDKLSSFSDYGASSVDLAAPGENILSTVPAQADPSGYASYGGTSMAAAVVSGAATLYASRYPNASGLQIRSALLSSTRSMRSLSGRVASGGRLDLARALGAPAPDRTAPTPFRLLSPKRGTLRETKRTRFQWQRSYDASGVRAYRVYVDGRLRKVVKDRGGRGGHPIATQTRIRLSAGRHIWSVRAQDRAGNVRVASAGGGKSAKALRVTRRH